MATKVLVGIGPNNHVTVLTRSLPLDVNEEPELTVFKDSEDVEDNWEEALEWILDRDGSIELHFSTVFTLWLVHNPDYGIVWEGGLPYIVKRERTPILQTLITVQYSIN